jgi:hypothetical protein
MLLEGRGVTGRSFPSGHAANNMAVATVLILFYRRKGWFYSPRGTPDRILPDVHRGSLAPRCRCRDANRNPRRMALLIAAP